MDKVKVVTISGSMRFAKEMMQIAEMLEIVKGYVVIQCIYDTEGKKFEEKDAEVLDKLHYHKIDLSDAIFVVNVGGYIGQSTEKEIEYAKLHGKEVMYLESETSVAERIFDILKSGQYEKFLQWVGIKPKENFSEEVETTVARLKEEIANHLFNARVYEKVLKESEQLNIEIARQYLYTHKDEFIEIFRNSYEILPADKYDRLPRRHSVRFDNIYRCELLKALPFVGENLDNANLESKSKREFFAKALGFKYHEWNKFTAAEWYNSKVSCEFYLPI